MFKKIAAFKESLNDNVTFNKKEYILTLTVCVLGGILFGMIITPTLKNRRNKTKLC